MFCDAFNHVVRVYLPAAPPLTHSTHPISVKHHLVPIRVKGVLESIPAEATEKHGGWVTSPSQVTHMHRHTHTYAHAMHTHIHRHAFG